MKKIVLLISLIAGMGTVLFAQEAALPRLAVVEFTTNVNTEKAKADAITVRNLVESRMVATGKYRMMTRDEIDKLLENQRIQVSSIASAENLTKLRLEQINYIITGSVDAMGGDYSITVRVLDVSNGEYPHIEDGFMGGDSRELRNGVNTLMGEFIAGMTRSGVSGTYTYNIGDRGPAGGIVFYDRGFTADGWRYLEAAPVEAEFTAQWGGYSGTGGKYSDFYDISGTETAVGSGKRNTQIIVDYLNRIGEHNRAAQICSAMEVNGYKGWFLPSKDELNLMQKNLTPDQVTDEFVSSHQYWSSSQFDNLFSWVHLFYSSHITYDDGTTYDNSQVYYNIKFSTLSVRAVRAF